MLQMSTLMRGGGGSTAGGSFPAPGTPGNAANPTTNPTSPTSPAPAPAQGLAPFASMFNPPTGGVAAGGFDPAMLQQLFGMGAAAGAGAGGQNPFGSGVFGGGAAAAPADTRPPEERFQVQLQVRSSMRG